MESKKELRIRIKQRLLTLSFFELIQKSASLSQNFIQTFDEKIFFKHAPYVISFHPFEYEPQVNIERETRDEPFQVGYVRIEHWELKSMGARQARRDQPGDWEELEPVSGLKIQQPHPATRSCLPEEIGVILVPGLGFTEEGARLGHGAGFYDRFLETCPQALRVGVALEVQVLPDLPEQPWDQRVDALITDARIVETKRFTEWKKHGSVLSRAQARV